MILAYVCFMFFYSWGKHWPTGLTVCVKAILTWNFKVNDFPYHPCKVCSTRWLVIMVNLDEYTIHGLFGFGFWGEFMSPSKVDISPFADNVKSLPHRVVRPSASSDGEYRNNVGWKKTLCQRTWSEKVKLGICDNYAFTIDVLQLWTWGKHFITFLLNKCCWLEILVLLTGCIPAEQLSSNNAFIR